MAYVTVPKDLSKVKNKVAFNLTRRQLVCIGIGAALGIPAYFLSRGLIGTSNAATLMMILMIPEFLFAMYENNDNPGKAGTSGGKNRPKGKDLPGKKARKKSGKAGKGILKKGKKEKHISAQDSIRYKEMGRDGICRQFDAFDDVRMEYAQMLKNQLAKGNNGLVKSKYITFAIEAANIQEAKPRLERIESDIMNNFKILGAPAYPLNGAERLEILRQTFNPEDMANREFDYNSIITSGMSTKDYVAPTSFVFRDGKTFEMGNTIGAASYLQILAPELNDKMLAEFLDMIWTSSHQTLIPMEGKRSIYWRTCSPGMRGCSW